MSSDPVGLCSQLKRDKSLAPPYHPGSIPHSHTRSGYWIPRRSNTPYHYTSDPPPPAKNKQTLSVSFAFAFPRSMRAIVYMKSTPHINTRQFISNSIY